MIGLLGLLHLSLQPLLVSPILQPPTNLSLISQNFQHVLTWEEPNDERLVYYDVLYSKDHSHFVQAKTCANLTIQRCDLTTYFTDILSEYNTGVQSFTHDERSNVTYLQFPLTPLVHTVVGPPIVGVTPCDSCIELSIRPPISYLWDEKEQRNVTMLRRNVFPKVDYLIHLLPSVNAPKKRRRVSDEDCTTRITSLLPNANYCVSVIITGIISYKQVPSPVKCAVTKGTQGKGDTSIYYITAFAVILAAGLLLLLCAMDKAGYISRKKTFTPNVLKSLPNAIDLLNRNKESTPLVSLSLTVRDTEDQDSHILRVGVPENVSYIANNLPIRIMEQHMRNENSAQEELPIENSPVSITTLQLQGVSISKEAAGNQETASLSIADITQEHPVGSIMSNMNMGVLSDDVITRDDMKETPYILSRDKNVTIDFNSVSVVDPGDLWEGCCKTEPSRQEPELAHMYDPVGGLRFTQISDELILGEPQMSGSEDEVAENDTCTDNCDEQCPGYVKR